MKKITFLTLLMALSTSGAVMADELEFNWNSNQGETKMVWLSFTAGKSITVDYGDGSGSFTYNGAGAGIANLQTLDHTYAQAGNYKVTVKTVGTDASITDFDSYLTGITSFKATALPELTYISLSESPVTSCDLADCAKLKEVYLMGTTLTSLDLSGKKFLQTVALQTEDMANPNRKGYLKTISFQGCDELTNLTAFNNQLESVNLSGCTKLRNFTSENNTLTSLDLSGLSALEDVRCNNNSLQTLNLTGCTSLRQLWAYNNEITSIDVHGITSLIRLEAYNNNLETLNVKNCSSLQYLEANNNQINGMDLTGCTSLAMADLSQNAIPELDATMCSELEDLRVYSNAIENLTVAGLPKLAILHFHNNMVKHIDLSGLPLIESIDANNNRLEDLDLSEITNLYELRLFGNRLPLSVLYAASQIVSIPVNCQMGDQTLLPKDVKVNDEIDLTSEAVLGGSPTTFTVLKGENAAASSDYEINNGKLVFKTIGEYDVKMTNPAIQSFEERPAVVTAHYSVTGNTGIENLLNGVDEPATWYDLQGRRVINPDKGIFIKKTGNKTEKVIL